MTRTFYIPRLFLLGLAITVVVASGCKDDEQPVTATIYGTIDIENVDTWANWVDSGEVQLTIFPEFSLDPPAGWGAVPDDFFGPGVPGGTYALGAPVNAQNPIVLQYTPGASSFSYEIELDPGTYSALALGFRHAYIQDPSLRSATLGVYWGMPNIVSHGIRIAPAFNEPPPAAITVKAGDRTELNFKADFAFVEVWY